MTDNSEQRRSVPRTTDCRETLEASLTSFDKTDVTAAFDTRNFDL
jgi:hypothetical protein